MTQFKKAILISGIILLVISIAVISFAVETGKITKEAKLRKTTSTNSIVLEIIPKNEDVEILEKDGDWYQVRYNKIKGYVQSGFIDVPESFTNEVTNTQTEEQTNNEDLPQISENIEKGNIVKAKIEGKLLIRPLINSLELASINVNDPISIMQILNDWVYVNISGIDGWVRIEVLKGNTQNEETVQSTEETTNNENNEEEQTNSSTENTETKKEQLNKKAYISASGINFRKEPNTSSEIIRVFTQNAEITILEESGNWYKVKYKDEEGYVVKTYVSEKKVTTSRSAGQRQSSNASNTKTTNTSEVKEKSTAKVENTAKTGNTASKKATSKASSKGQEIANYAKQYVGYKYVYGGSTPSGGFDCSGLTMYVYQKFGVSLPHSATSQSKKGTKVSKSELQPGDLVFFSNYKTLKGIGHVGIYIGNNQFVHASTKKTGVKISSLNSGSYVKRYVTATRFF